MTKNIKYLILVILIPFFVFSQNNELDGFSNLMNKTWIAEGKWSNGDAFKYETTFKYQLNKSIVIVNSKGHTNKEKTLFGNLSHGVRHFSKVTNKIEFWEFDIFGNQIRGIVELKDKDIWYHYEYGNIYVTDHWQNIDKSTYKFTVGNYKEGKWSEIYLQTKFKLKEH